MSQFCAPSIQKISLLFSIGDEFVIQLCESMTASKNVEHFSFYLDDITPRGAQALSSFLRSSVISTLEFTVAPETIITAIPAMATMQTLYLEGIQHCQHIQKLVVGVVGDMDALVSIVPKLCELAIKRVGLSLAEVEQLTRGLSNAHQLCTLQLYQCRLRSEHMSILSPVIGNHPSIRKVELYYNSIGDAGIAAFVDHWRPESSIDELVLHANAIGPKGADRLIRASSNRSTMQLLDLMGDCSIGFDGLRLIGEALPNAKIQKLGLTRVIKWREYRDVNCEEAIAQGAKCMAAWKALVEGVRGNVHLLDLQHDGNPKFPVIMAEIDLYVDANVRGRGAVFENQHALPSGVWCYFLAKRGMSSSLMFLFLQELPSVVMGGNRNSVIGRKRCRA